MTGDLAVWLRAQLDADEQTAQAASRRRGQSIEGGVHWHWDNIYTDQPVTADLSAEFLADGDAVSLRSDETFPTDWVGPLPQFALDQVQEVESGVAEHIARHDPAFTLADITAKRAIIDLHECAPGPIALAGNIDPAGWRESDIPHCDADWAPYPCDTIRLLARPYAGRSGWQKEWELL